MKIKELIKFVRRFLSFIAFLWVGWALSVASPLPRTRPKAWSGVSGKVFFNGIPPKMKLITMPKEPFCDKARRHHPIREEFVIVNPNKTLRNVVVFISAGIKRKKFPERPPVVLDQANCWFKPHILAVMAGQTVKAINNDPGVLHNFHFMCRVNPPLNFSEPGEPKGGMFPVRNVIFRKPEMIPLICDIHPWMNAVVAVMPNPYYKVTKEDGTFSISELPAGTYTLEAWHEKYGAIRKKITLKSGEKAHMDFQFQ